MRKFLALLLTLPLLCFPVRGSQTKYVALTFDDGPSGRFTRRLLEGLEQRGAHATFFLCGYRLEEYGDLAAGIRAGGHEIGLHGYSHRDLTAMSPEEAAQELRQTRALVPAPVVNLMRTPGGRLTDSIRQTARQAGLSLVHWSLDTRDWQLRDADAIQNRVMEAVSDGDIILMHDLSDASVTAALNLVDTLQAQGYRFLTVSQLAMLRLTQLGPGQQYRCFPAKEFVNLS